MKKKFLEAAIVMVSLSVSVVQAVPSVIYDGGSGYAVGITNLGVSGGVFNVAFVPDSYDAVYAVDAPVFLGNETFADAAADAIMNALNAEVSVPQVSGGTSEVLWVPYENDGVGGFYAEQTGHGLLSDPWQRYADFYGSTATDYSGPPTSWLFAQFTRVPEPGTIALLGMGMMAILRKQ